MAMKIVLPKKFTAKGKSKLATVRTAAMRMGRMGGKAMRPAGKRAATPRPKAGPTPKPAPKGKSNFAARMAAARKAKKGG